MKENQKQTELPVNLFAQGASLVLGYSGVPLQRSLPAFVRLKIEEVAKQNITCDEKFSTGAQKSMDLLDPLFQCRD
jgi:hypothetical protein